MKLISILFNLIYRKYFNSACKSYKIIVNEILCVFFLAKSGVYFTFAAPLNLD